MSIGDEIDVRKSEHAKRGERGGFGLGDMSLGLGLGGKGREHGDADVHGGADGDADVSVGGEVDVHEGEHAKRGERGGFGLGDMSLGLGLGGKGREHGDADVHGGAHGDADVSLGGEVDVHEGEHAKRGERGGFGLGDMSLGLGLGGKGREHGDADVHGGAHGDADVSVGGKVDVHEGEHAKRGERGGFGLGDMSLGLGLGGKGREHGDADVHDGAHGDADVSLGGEVDVHEGEHAKRGERGGFGLGDMSLGLGLGGKGREHGDADVHDGAHGDADVSVGGEVDVHEGERAKRGERGGFGLGDMSLGLGLGGKGREHGDADVHGGAHGDAARAGRTTRSERRYARSSPSMSVAVLLIVVASGAAARQAPVNAVVTARDAATSAPANTTAPPLGRTRGSPHRHLLSAANFTSFIPATMDRGCQDWFFGGSCVRANPEDEPTAAEFGGAIFGIVIASLLLIPALTLCGAGVGDDRGDMAFAGGAASLCLLFVLCVSIAALQEVS